MKKFLVLLLALVMCVCAFAACGGEETPEVTYKLDKAVAYVRSLYINEQVKPEDSDVATATKYADFERVSSVPIAGVIYDVEWSVDVTDETKVKVVQGSGTTATKIDVNERTTEDITFVLTATVKAGDGTSDTLSFNFIVPAYNPITFEEYMAAKDGDQVTVEGIVVAINSKAAGNSRNHLFLADASGKGGYYSYQMDQDPVKDLGIEVGMTVAVSGPVTPYSGMQEIKGGTARILDTNKKTVDVLDITEQFKSGADLKNYVGLPVTIKGVEIGGQELETSSSQYLFFSLNGVQAYVRTYITDFPTTLEIIANEDSTYSSADKTYIDELHASKFGWTANATGILVLYSGNPYLIPMSRDCFEYTELVEKTAEEKIAIELDAITMVDKLGADKTVDVITAGANYADVVITWTSNSEYAVVAADGKSIAFTIPKAATTVTITATAKLGETTVTKTFEVALTPITVSYAPNTPYYFGFTDKAGVKKYLDGTTQSSANYRWNLTDDVSKAVPFYVEVVEGGYYVYFMSGETKTYLNIVKNGNYTNLLAGTEAKSVWTYDVSLETLVVEVEGKIYVPKNYKNYGNVEAKTPDYEAAADNTYTAGLVAIEYNFGFENNGAMQYLDGKTSSKEFRWDLTADPALAATFYLEGNADGTFYIYFYREGLKTYINIVKNGTYINLLAGDSGLSKWSFSAEYNAFVVTVDDVVYMPKNYGGYKNVEAKKFDYTSGDTFALSLFAVGYKPATPEVTPPEGGETPGGDTPPAGFQVVLPTTGTNLVSETVFPGIEPSSGYAGHNGDHTVGNLTVSTNNVMSGTQGTFNVIQFKKGGSTFTVKNATVTTITFLVVSTYDYTGNVDIKVGDTVVTLPDAATVNAAAVNTGVMNGANEYKAYTVTVTLNSALTGDLVITNNLTYAVYMPYINIQ